MAPPPASPARRVTSTPASPDASSVSSARPRPRPALVHDQVTERAYAGAHALTGALVRGSAYAYGLTRRDDTPALETDHRGRLALGALNGAFGDMLERTGNPLAMPDDHSPPRAGPSISIRLTSPQ